MQRQHERPRSGSTAADQFNVATLALLTAPTPLAAT
jgi:hypothetical protein